MEGILTYSRVKTKLFLGLVIVCAFVVASPSAWSSGFVDYYEKIENMAIERSHGGFQVKDVSHCEYVCTVDSECQSFDYNSSSKMCHYSKESTLVAQIKPKNGFDHHRRWRFAKIENSMVIPATPVAGGESITGVDLQVCLRECSEKTWCMSTNYQSNNESCFLNPNIAEEGTLLSNLSGSDSYTKVLFNPYSVEDIFSKASQPKSYTRLDFPTLNYLWGGLSIAAKDHSNGIAVLEPAHGAQPATPPTVVLNNEGHDKTYWHLISHTASKDWGILVQKDDKKYPSGMDGAGSIVAVSVVNGKIHFYRISSSDQITKLGELVLLNTDSRTGFVTVGTGSNVGIAYHEGEQRYYVLAGKGGTGGKSYTLYALKYKGSMKQGVSTADFDEIFDKTDYPNGEAGMSLVYDSAKNRLVAFSLGLAKKENLVKTNDFQWKYLGLRASTDDDYPWSSVIKFPNPNLTMNFPQFRWGGTVRLRCDNLEIYASPRTASVPSTSHFALWNYDANALRCGQTDYAGMDK